MTLRRSLTITVAVGAVTLSLAGCAPEEEPGPYDESAVMRPDLIQPATDFVSPGDTLEIFFPEETGRGIAWSLESRSGDEWNLQYFMTASSGEVGGEPSWVDAADPDEYAWIDIGIVGPGPDLVPIPDTAEPGEYRLCTANSAPNICAEITIES